MLTYATVQYAWVLVSLCHLCQAWQGHITAQAAPEALAARLVISPALAQL